MEHQPADNDHEKLNILVVPFLTLFGWRDKYYLSDFAYGEFIVLYKNKPKYYLSVFDELYRSAFDDLSKNKISISGFLEERFRKKKIGLSMRNKTWGIRFDSKEHLEEFSLEKLPVSFFDPTR